MKIMNLIATAIDFCAKYEKWATPIVLVSAGFLLAWIVI